MTVRELRNILFSIENQELTVKELRGILFEIDEQDEELTDSKIYKLTKITKWLWGEGVPIIYKILSSGKP